MRATYVLRGNRLVEKQKAPPQSGAFHVLSDIQPFVTQGGQPIGSRSHLRDYERAHGVKQVGNDFASEIAKMKEKLNGTHR